MDIEKDKKIAMTVSDDVGASLPYGVDNDIEPESDAFTGDSITVPFSPNDIKLSTPPMNLGDLIDSIKYGYIDFKTSYQRSENLWSQEKQSRLIESALLGLRLPAFYFEEVSRKKWRIIDGLQRCCSLRNFCVDQTLKLSNLEFLSQYDGKSFSEMPFDFQRDIRMLPITVNLLEAGAPDKVRYVLFKRLNTGGLTLTAQEIRNAVYYGKAIDTVERLARMPEFLEATGGKIPADRHQDMDFVSRFVAFYLIGYEKYTDVSDIDNFINDCMEGLNQGLYDSQLAAMTEGFRRAMVCAKAVFGKDAFRKRVAADDPYKPLNKAYFEVIAVGLSKLTDAQVDLLVRNKEVLKNNLMHRMATDTTYANSFSGGTGRYDRVRNRFSEFNNILSNSLSGNLMP